MNATKVDLRVDLFRRIEKDHMVHAAGTKDSSQGEHWYCRCGKRYSGLGALEKGRRHVAKKVLAALDEAAGVA